MKKIVSVILAVAMMMCMTACAGLDIGKVKGDWTLSTVNGKTVEEYAAELGVEPYMIVVNATVTDTQYTSQSANAVATYPISVKANGFEVLSAEGGDIMMSVKYNGADDTLSYKVDIDGTVYEYVLTKGTGDITPPAADENAEANAE